MNSLTATDGFNIIKSICDWNAARYAQEASVELNISLLTEEYCELRDAVAVDNAIEVLDALGDIFYVAIGALWKAGAADAYITELLAAQNALTVPPLKLGLDWYCETTEEAVLGYIALACLHQLGILVGPAAVDVIQAICVSNNTKQASKTAASVKANKKKGDSYVPPTKALQQILARNGVCVND